MGVSMNTRREKLRCQGTTADGVRTKFPMKAVVFARDNPSGSVAVLYRPGSGKVIGAFSYEALVTLEVTAREARIALSRLHELPPKSRRRRAA